MSVNNLWGNPVTITSSGGMVTIGKITYRSFEIFHRNAIEVRASMGIDGRTFSVTHEFPMEELVLEMNNTTISHGKDALTLTALVLGRKLLEEKTLRYAYAAKLESSSENRLHDHQIDMANYKKNYKKLHRQWKKQQKIEAEKQQQQQQKRDAEKVEMEECELYGLF